MAVLALFVPVLAMSGQMTGKVQSISRKASTIQLLNLKSKTVEVIRFGKSTKYVNAKSIKEFITNDKIVVDVDAGQVANSIKRVLVKVDPAKIIGTKEVAALLQRPAEEYLIVDALPAGRYNAGHIPGSISQPTGAFAKTTQLLPKDKNRLLVFYCGGPT